MATIIVTRHPALVEYIHELRLAPDDAPVLDHVSAADVVGQRVIGVLPLSLAQYCESVTEIPMDIPRELRGAELTIDQVRQYAGAPVTYRVSLDLGPPWPAARAAELLSEAAFACGRDDLAPSPAMLHAQYSLGMRVPLDALIRGATNYVFHRLCGDSADDIHVSAGVLRGAGGSLFTVGINLPDMRERGYACVEAVVRLDTIGIHRQIVGS